MPRIDVDQSVVLERIVDRLRSALDLTERQCFIALSPQHLPKMPKGGEYFVAVSGGGGQFVEGEQVPGNITEQWSVYVTAYSRIQLDSTDHADSLLMDDGRGLLKMKKRILAALVGQDLTVDTEESSGSSEIAPTFLRQLLFARSATEPGAAELNPGNLQIGVITLEFGVEFDWDLTNALPGEA